MVAANSELTRAGLRFLLATVVGSAVFVISILTVWQSWGMAIGRDQQHWTRYSLKMITKAITLYRDETHAFPESLDKLRQMKDLELDIAELNDEGFNVVVAGELPLSDAWNRPFIYSTDGASYSVTSYGQDGEPGGVGLDYDLSNKNCSDRLPIEARPTFWQFFHDLLPGGMMLTVIASAILAGVLSLRAFKPSSLKEQAAFVSIAKFMRIIVAAVLTAVFISYLHIPTGH